MMKTISEIKNSVGEFEVRRECYRTRCNLIKGSDHLAVENNVLRDSICLLNDIIYDLKNISAANQKETRNKWIVFREERVSMMIECDKMNMICQAAFYRQQIQHFLDRAWFILS